MIEFGSDFHRCDSPFHGETTLDTLLPSRQLYASGRMALLAVARQQGWKRLWVPAYFCHEIIDAWKKEIEVRLYDDYPLEMEDDAIVRSLPYETGDALLRMNYFGLRGCRSNRSIAVPVVEDHSHALNSEWALRSDADWCVASLRKSLPLAFGGVLWSPKGLQLPKEPDSEATCNRLAAERYEAMALKAQYLHDGGDKETFRRKFIATEEGLDGINRIAAIDDESRRILQNLDVAKWNEQKQKNWQVTCRLLERLEVVGRNEASAPFSIIIRMPDKQARDRFRRYLIETLIYPATLWNIPEDVPFARCKDFGERMLSIHCDARYSEQDIQQMCEEINNYDANH